jgi:hypothetical protein
MRRAATQATLPDLYETLTNFEKKVLAHFRIFVKLEKGFSFF